MLLSRAHGAGALVLLQLFHGLTFGLFWGASIRMLGGIIPPALRATGQALYAAVVFGGGNAVGYQLSGLGYDRFGGVGPLFAAAAALETILLDGERSCPAVSFREAAAYSTPTADSRDKLPILHHNQCTKTISAPPKGPGGAPCP